MKINYACGYHVREGWFNVDAVRHPRAPRDPELIFALRFNPNGTLIEKTPLPDECAKELAAIHILEHFYRWEAPHVLKEWWRLLAPGGKLILELPDIEKCAKNLIAEMTDQFCMWGFYGDPGYRDPYMCHKWGYTPKTLQPLVETAGFQRVKLVPPTDHGSRLHRDMRLEMVK